jgi:hypothetical protein
MLVFLLVLLIGGLGGFGYWAYTQGYLKSIPFLKIGSDNSTTTPGKTNGAKLTVPPTLTGVTTGTKAIKEVAILWKSDQLSSSQVEWGPFGSFTTKTTIEMDPTSGNSIGTTDHGVIIKGLQANTKYQYRVISKNKDGLETVSSPANDFTTPSE